VTEGGSAHSGFVFGDLESFSATTWSGVHQEGSAYSANMTKRRMRKRRVPHVREGTSSRKKEEEEEEEEEKSRKNTMKL
jgi:hypothetical protein